MRQKHFIKEWRKFRGLTQIQLAERIGMNQGNLSKIESGTRQYDQEFLELAADALRCEVPDLLVRDPTGPEAIWSIWEQLDAPARLQVVEIAKTFKKVS
jgi:transcriptional regulator with XRE-family HTH domain